MLQPQELKVGKLRGVKRLLELGGAEQAPEEGKPPSHLARKLISLWAHGLLSARAMQEIAACALQDGAQHESVYALAKVGNFGSSPQNCQRDVYRSVLKELALPEPFRLRTEVKDAVTQTLDKESFDLLLPHEMFAALSHYKAFATMFDAGNLKKFWLETQQRDDDRLRKHPCTLEKGWECLTFPLFLHGDGVEYQTRDSLMVYSWGNALQKESNSLGKHLLCAAFPKSVTTPATWEAPWDWLRWSFEHLAKGFHPLKDPWGKPLQKGSRFYKLRGSFLTPQGFRGVLWFIQGDHDFHSNVLLLPHWASRTPCFACDATLAGGEKPCKRLEWDAFQFWDSQQVLAMPETHGQHPVFSIPGCTARMCRWDSLHVLYTKGLYGHILGSCLHYLCWYDPPGNRQKVQPSDRLNVIFREIQKQYTLQKVGCRLTNLQVKMFVKDLKSPWSTWANLTAKGAECKHLAPCLLPVFKASLDLSRPEHPRLVECLQCLVALTKALDESDVFLTDNEFNAFFDLAKRFVESYSWLNAHFEAAGRPLFHIVNKSHSFLHWAWEAFYVSPKLHACWLGEDFVGRMAKLGHSISLGPRPRS